MTLQEQNFIEKMAGPAIQAEQESGIPAPVAIAQAILESSRPPLPNEPAGGGWGQTDLAREDNNYFGIKALQGQDYCEFDTGEYVNGHKEMVHARFAKFRSIEDCFTAHTRLLTQLRRYAPAMAHKDSLSGFALGLQQCGYSTSEDPITHKPDYAAKLIRLIAEFGLDRFGAPRQLPPPAQVA